MESLEDRGISYGAYSHRAFDQVDLPSRSTPQEVHFETKGKDQLEGPPRLYLKTLSPPFPCKQTCCEARCRRRRGSEGQEDLPPPVMVAKVPQTYRIPC